MAFIVGKDALELVSSGSSDNLIIKYTEIYRPAVNATNFIRNVLICNVYHIEFSVSPFQPWKLDVNNPFMLQKRYISIAVSFLGNLFLPKIFNLYRIVQRPLKRQ
jgi:hypothetical protein